MLPKLLLNVEYKVIKLKKFQKGIDKVKIKCYNLVVNLNIKKTTVMKRVGT